MRVRAWLTSLLATALLAPSLPAAAQQDLIHSDLPLWVDDQAQMWPQPFHDPDAFGCRHRLQLGDWRYTERGAEKPGGWFRLANYGFVHCYIVERRAFGREDLETAESRFSFLIDLGAAAGPNGEVQLWALQSGALPGSDYMLLASRRSEAPVASFDVLQRRCPPAAVRDAGRLDLLGTRYCAINSQQDLRTLARRMARLPPLGALQWAEGQAGKDR